MSYALLVLGVALQAIAVIYGILLATHRRGAISAWLCLLSAMASMLVWRVVVLFRVTPPAFFNPLIAIWGSTCMLAAMFLFGREVARRERAESERDALLESERIARGEAERANRLKDDFLATLSHELRTPLAAVLGWCALLRSSEGKAEQIARGIDTIERNARTQARLVDDLLDVTRMQAGTLSLELNAVDLTVPVQNALQSVQPAAEAKSISISLQTNGVPQVVRGDVQRLQQVVSNLLTNAVKFTPEGRAVRVTLAGNEREARLTVVDEGEGIDPAFLPHLFTRFRQAEVGNARRHGGLGLGLSIVSSLVRLHGGEVRVTSAGKDKGTEVTVTLPLATILGEAAQHAGSDGPVSLRGIRMILVDDQADVREAVGNLLERLGAQVTTLASGEDIEAVIAREDPHVLLLDIGMPHEDGYTLVRRLRKLPASRGGGIPAISLTAHAREEDRAHALASGFHEHLAKPIDLPRLTAAIQRLAATSARESEPSPAGVVDSVAHDGAR